MTHQLTQKERSLIQDQLAHEEICIKKYRGYANLTKSQELRKLFNEMAQEEQNHYDTLNRYLGGQGRAQQAQQQQEMQQRQIQQQQMQQQQIQQQQMQQPQEHLQTRGSGFEPGQFDRQTHAWSQQFQQQAQQGQGQQAGAVDDAAMCQDMLMTEKFVSGAYDTSVFESANPQLRQDLQRIQQDEQKHGEKIFNYMQKHGYYNPQ
ncbi:MAG TPA: spore coat protein [Firmicutes bacterium]|jgi:spore coat protein CotF|nr:spore coat protein [Candidatus Fermentithermobacillaceae bacterium]